jgi:hypothetical protein
MALDGSKLSASRSGRFISGKESPITTGNEDGSIVGLDALEKRKISFPCLEPNPDLLADHPVPHRYTVSDEQHNKVRKVCLYDQKGVLSYGT